MAARVRTSPASRSVGSGRRARTGHVGVRSGGRGHARGGGPVALGSGHRRNRARPPRTRLARGHPSLPPAVRARHNFKGAPGARARGGRGGSSSRGQRARARVSSAPSRVVKPQRKTGVKMLLTGSPETCLQWERLSSKSTA